MTQGISYLLARQPIFDCQQEVYGYEILLYSEELKIDCGLISMAYMESIKWYNKLVEIKI